MGILSKVYTGKKIKEMSKTTTRNGAGTQSNRPASTLPQRNKPVGDVEKKTGSASVAQPVEEKKEAFAGKEVVVSTEPVKNNYEVSVQDKEKYEAMEKKLLSRSAVDASTGKTGKGGEK